MISPEGYEIDFVSYPYLILLISGQTFEITLAHKFFWELNRPLEQANYFIFELTGLS